MRQEYYNDFVKPNEQRPSLLGLCHGEKTKAKPTISLSQKTKGSLLALAWRELTTSREERLSLLRLSRGAKEEDESQLTTSREERLSLLRLSRGAKEEDESQIALLRTQK